MKAFYLLGVLAVFLAAGCTAAPVETQHAGEEAHSEPVIAAVAQEVDGNVVVINEAFLDKPGYIVIHKVVDGSPGAVVGNSGLLDGDIHDESVPVSGAEGEPELIAMLHYDDGDGSFDLTSDAPATHEGEVVLAKFAVTAAAPEAAGKVVEVTASGFAPSVVSIKAGETVTWANNDGPARWPASNRHPIHIDYPADYSGGSYRGLKTCLGPGEPKTGAFDACKVLEPGDSYTFTFSERGEWAYHDHLNPAAGGVVVVG